MLECLTLLSRPANYRLSNKIAYASESSSLLNTYKVQISIQELGGRVITPMPKDIADLFEIPYIKFSNIDKWSNKEYKLPKESNKYFPRKEDKDTEGAKASKTSISSEDLDSPVGTWVAAIVPKMLLVPYG